MTSTFDLFMGIDLTISPNPMTYIVLDASETLIALGEGDIGDALAFAAGVQVKLLVAVTFPARPNNGRMAKDEVRQHLHPQPEKDKYRALRQSEYELISSGIEVPPTPGSKKNSPYWMKRGFLLVEWLQKLNYRAFPLEEAPRQWLEVQVEAAFWSLLEVRPLLTGSLEGRIQRQLALENFKLAVPHAMDFFEEITPYKLLKGNLPMKYILPQAEINAWLAAHTAWLAANHPEKVSRFGDAEEGVLFLPRKI